MKPIRCPASRTGSPSRSPLGFVQHPAAGIPPAHRSWRCHRRSRWRRLRHSRRNRSRPEPRCSSSDSCGRWRPPRRTVASHRSIRSLSSIPEPPQTCATNPSCAGTGSDVLGAYASQARYTVRTPEGTALSSRLAWDKVEPGLLPCASQTYCAQPRSRSTTPRP